ncbi:PepSY-associated TM helix domain-containing protein [Bryobacter aggregatus]|uniref:PepSY-associated TM helix domain-containing protein n=1 Tax=Bryobacter aggregatus TaxID=360054 RepID=UPI0012BAFBEE|nr:PepSY-associated TM helix domain-containing protein [Bryobacter aggregatus]
MNIASPAAEPQVARARTPAWKRQTAILSRWLHIYLSMVSFGVLFFFAVTGLTLNHTDWFGQAEKTVQLKGQVSKAWLRQADPDAVSKLEIVEHLRNKHQIRGALSDFRVDAAQCAVSFKGPGYTADTFIDRETGAYDLTETRMGVVAILNDLHKGRDSGKVWSLLIDASAILMVLVSISGMLLILFLQKRLVSGMVTMVVGCVLCYAIYALWVP